MARQPGDGWRDVVGWWAGGLAAVAGAAWAVYVHFNPPVPPVPKEPVVLCRTEYSRDCGGRGVWIACGDVPVKGAEVCKVKPPLASNQWREISSVSHTHCGLSYYNVWCP